MRKEIVNDIFKVKEQNNIKASECCFPYKKNGYKTLSDYTQYLKSEVRKMQRIQNQRKNKKSFEFSHQATSERFEQYKKDLIKKLLGSLCNTNNGVDVISIESNDNFKFDVDEETDWNYFAKSYRYPKVWKTSEFYLNLTNFRPKYAEIDGLINVEILKEKQENEIIILNTKTIKRVKGYNFILVNMFIAFQNELAYHSEESEEKAVKGLERKIKQLQKKNEPISLESIMTANKYIKLTGACRAGTENFLNKHDFDFKTKIKIKDLLPLLEESNEWGLSRIKELLQKIN